MYSTAGIKRNLGRVYSRLGVEGAKSGDLVVLNMHVLDVADIERFVERHSKRFSFATQCQLLSSTLNAQSSARPTIVLTFDDGFASHYSVAEYLASRGIGAIFFVVPGFVSSSCPTDYAASHILRPTSDWSRSDLDNLKPLSRGQILALADMGHIVGSHTMNHSIYPGMSPASLRREIIESRDWLEDLIGRRVSAFAGPFTSDLLDGRALELIAESYQFNFLTYPCRATALQPGLVWRSNVEARWGVMEQEYGLRGLAIDERRYSKRRQAIELMWSASTRTPDIGAAGLG